MDKYTTLIIDKKTGKDITESIAHYDYDAHTKQYAIMFHNNTKTYRYSVESLQILTNPNVIFPSMVKIYHNHHELFQIEQILVFPMESDSYWKLWQKNKPEKLYLASALEIHHSALQHTTIQDRFSYLHHIASCNELLGDDGHSLLKKSYDKLHFIGEDTALSCYLSPEQFTVKQFPESIPIFPFGINGSQQKAVKKALTNQISVIQGPPGTGKTQTILNIIANILLQGKTVQIVSNNNSATTNVLEKLSSEKYKLGFLVAPLGSDANKNKFIASQSKYPSDISAWQLQGQTLQQLSEQITDSYRTLEEIFSKQERIAVLKQELEQLLIEQKHFHQYCKDNHTLFAFIKVHHTLQSDNVMDLLTKIELFLDGTEKISLFYKFKSFFLYGITNWKFLKSNDLSSIISSLQNMFYEKKQSEIEKELDSLNQFLSSSNAQLQIDILTKQSIAFLKHILYQKYGQKKNRPLFTKDDLRKNPQNVLSEYPIILSTTFSSRSCLGPNTMYDYVIMDEASQVDIATGALALSCSKNAVIVGDLKQLPNVITEKTCQRAREIEETFSIPDGYAFTKNSFLKSICTVLPSVPQTLLREHYRCHPKIINFCNQKFYNNALLIMTKDNGETDVLRAFKTVEGNHKRGRTNQRQIDILINEVLPTLEEQQPTDVGIIAPYHDQVTAVSEQLKAFEVDTVHKFQGREKDTIILTTVDDILNSFSDDPYLLNVAVSRAKKRLCVITSGNLGNKDGNVNDLLSYIAYNNFEVTDSKTYSIFDYLYTQNQKKMLSYLKNKKKISAFASENLLYAMLMEVLADDSYTALDVIFRQKFNLLLSDKSLLTEEELNYVQHPSSHIDFLLYNKVGKQPVLAIEVDGYHYHKTGTPQAERDKMKNHILEIYQIPYIRFATNGSLEKEKLIHKLAELGY